MRDKPATDDDWIWSRFWQFDRVASCLDGDDHANYGAAVAAGWRTFFADLPRGAAVLDLCTGNGAIALLAVEADRDFRVTGVDRATIDPAAHVRKFADALSQITFRGGVSAEALPIADAGIDAVTSQYGIEYTDLDATLAEVVRVLKPGGRCRFVMHAAEGEVRAGANRVVADANRLLALPALAEEALANVVPVERAADPDPLALAQARRAFAAFTTALAEAAVYDARDTLMRDNSVAVIREVWDRRRDFALEPLVAKVREVATEIRAQRGRSAALSGAAVSQERLAQIAGQLAALGLTDLATEPLEVAGRLVGHVLTGVRAP